MWRHCRQVGIEPELRALMTPRLARSVGAALLDWVIIAAASLAALRWGGIGLAVAVLAIGNRQRALGNLLHDASHGSFDGKGHRGSMLANVLLCWPLWVSMRIYRADHLAHHRYLGDPSRDPDYIHDERLLCRGWRFLLWRQVTCARTIRTSALSHLGRMNLTEHSCVAAWWIVVLGVIAAVLGARHAAEFLCLWVAARVLVFHPITAFREISDHVGLMPGSLIGFSRNHPVPGWSAHFFHPHNNGFHLLHHLAPALPYHAFPKAHRMLMDWEPYRSAAQCTSYFWGEAAATSSWEGRASQSTSVPRPASSA